MEIYDQKRMVADGTWLCEMHGRGKGIPLCSQSIVKNLLLIVCAFVHNSIKLANGRYHGTSPRSCFLQFRCPCWCCSMAPIHNEFIHTHIYKYIYYLFAPNSFCFTWCEPQNSTSMILNFSCLIKILICCGLHPISYIKSRSTSIRVSNISNLWIWLQSLK